MPLSKMHLNIHDTIIIDADLDIVWMSVAIYFTIATSFYQRSFIRMYILMKVVLVLISFGKETLTLLKFSVIPVEQRPKLQVNLEFLLI